MKCAKCQGGYFNELKRLVGATAGLIGAQQTMRYQCAQCRCVHRIVQIGGSKTESHLEIIWDPEMDEDTAIP